MARGHSSHALPDFQKRHQHGKVHGLTTDQPVFIVADLIHGLDEEAILFVGRRRQGLGIQR